jgi:putative membrane protein insertion efficiency factor
METNKRIITKLTIQLIKCYRFFLSPIFGTSCRFHPSCSQYAIEAYEKNSFMKGTILILKRLLKCNPFFSGGEDPVSTHKHNRG